MPPAALWAGRPSVPCPTEPLRNCSLPTTAAIATASPATPTSTTASPITSGHELSVDADLGRFRADGSNYQPNRYVTPTTNELILERNYRMNTQTNITLRTLKVDYNQAALGRPNSARGFKLSSVRN